MAQTGVSGPVVVDGESFLDALFASAVPQHHIHQTTCQLTPRHHRYDG